jgi:hypothetical protein
MSCGSLNPDSDRAIFVCRGVDRRAVLLEFLELEAKYMAAKLELVLVLLAAYQHSLRLAEAWSLTLG